MQLLASNTGFSSTSLNPENLLEAINEATTGEDKIKLSSQILASEDLSLFKIAVLSRLLPTFVDVAFQNEDDQAQDYVTLSLLREQIKPWKWANPDTPQVLSGGMGAAYLSYADKCIKVLKKHFPNHSYSLDNFKDRDLRIMLAKKLETELGLELPEIGNEQNKAVQGPKKDHPQLPTSDDNQEIAKRDQDEFVEEESNSDLLWMIIGVLLLGVFCLSFKILRGRTAS